MDNRVIMELHISVLIKVKCPFPEPDSLESDHSYVSDQPL